MQSLRPRQTTTILIADTTLRRRAAPAQTAGEEESIATDSANLTRHPMCAKTEVCYVEPTGLHRAPNARKGMELLGATANVFGT